MQFVLNVFYYLFGSCGCQRQAWDMVRRFRGKISIRFQRHPRLLVSFPDLIYQLSKIGNLEIGRTEIISPLRDAMSFIDNEQTYIHILEFRLEEAGFQSFGRNIQETIVLGDYPFERLEYLLLRHSHIYCCRLYSSFGKVVALVLHQRNKWSDNKRQPAKSDGRDLESDALSSAGRHQSQSIMTL